MELFLKSQIIRPKMCFFVTLNKFINLYPKQEMLSNVQNITNHIKYIINFCFKRLNEK
jgi:hypothetical protein